MNIIFDLSDFGIDVRKKTFISDGIEYNTIIFSKLLSVITNKYMYEKDGFETCKVHSSDLLHVTPDYLSYINVMISKDIIHRINYYEVGKFPKGIYFKDHFKEYAKVLKIETKGKIEEKIFPVIYIDTKTRNHIWRDYQDLMVNDYHPKKKFLFEVNGQKVYDFKAYLFNCAYLYELNLGRRSFKWKNDDSITQDYRLYTRFDLLSSDVRKNAIYFKNNLIEFDIPSSFALFLGIWMIKTGLIINDYDTKEFYTNLFKGSFYKFLWIQYIKEISSFKNDNVKFISKDDVKFSFIKWLNGGKNHSFNNIMEKKFPEICDFLKEKNGNKEINYMFFQLAQMESNFIFNTVCKRLYEEIDGIQILTCHDAIYVDSEFDIPVGIIWGEEIKKLKDLIPYFSSCDDDLDVLEIPEICEYLDTKKIDKEKISNLDKYKNFFDDDFDLDNL